MPCRHADDGDGGDVDAQSFAKTALLLGGPRAIQTAVDREGTPTLPAGRGESGDRQYDWTTEDGGGCPAHGGSDEGGPSRDDDGRGRDGDTGGCPVDHSGSDAEKDGKTSDDDNGDRAPSPRYHLLLSLSLAAPPEELDAGAVERALSALESELGWGPDGVLAAIGYSPAYFARFEEPLPLAVGIDPAFAPTPDPVAADGGRGPEDALLHLASDDARLLLAAEEAIWGGDPVIDLELDATLSGTFERPRDPSARRPAVATGDGLAPTGAFAIDRGRFAGGAVQRIDTVENAGADAPSNCPAHEGDATAPATGHEVDGPNLVRLGADGSVPLSVTFGPPDPDGDPDAEAYLVPPVSERSLPFPAGG